MLLSIEWLRDYLQKPDTRIDPGSLADKLTMRGIQVSSIRHPSGGLENVVVGRILGIEKHPNADRLQVTRVAVSKNPDVTPLQIVCGAKNIAEGDIVPVALVGATLPGDFKIKQSSIRGVESSGMLCSAKELGVADDAEGILQLPKNSTLGEPVARLLGHKEEDILFELEVTTNRFDCLSVLGLAREIAPLLKTKIRDPKPARFRVTPHRTSSIIKIEVEDPIACPRYVARVLDTLKVQPSPDWMQKRLESVGMRPINNIVDITNFVMLETGQPLHAFDLRKIESGLIRVAPCKAPMPFTLLDGKTVELEPGDILILDGERPVALAGIMGGANSQISDDTTSIVLETAAFDPLQIRKTAKRLGLITESSKRFEKASDLAAVAFASERAAVLLRDSFNANVYHPPIDTNETGPNDNVIAVDLRDVKRLSGLKELTAESIVDLLEQIQISAHKKSDNIILVRLPTFRPDLQESVDVVEEIVRLYGYDRIPTSLPISLASYDRLDESFSSVEKKVRNAFANQLGFRETIHYSFTAANLLDRCGFVDTDRIELSNPISEDMKVLRTHLIPSLFQTYLFNKNRKVKDQRLFEMANVYHKDSSLPQGVRETHCVAALWSGSSQAVNWESKSKPVTFYTMKSVVEWMARMMTTAQLRYEPPKGSRILHPNRSALIKLGDQEIGFVGEVHPVLRESFLKAQEPIVILEVNLEALGGYERTQFRYKAPSKFPGVDFDLAFTLENSTQSLLLTEALKQAAGPLLGELSLFDVYQGENVGAGKKSLAYRVNLRSFDRTLLDEEGKQVRDKMILFAKEKCGAELRG